MRSLSFLLRKMLSEVMPGLQQLNREAHPRRERRPRNCLHALSRIALESFLIAGWLMMPLAWHRGFPASLTNAICLGQKQN
jgi:hypothetical protein